MKNVGLNINDYFNRSITAVVGWVKVFLQTEQKRTDFKPETEGDTVGSLVKIIC